MFFFEIVLNFFGQEMPKQAVIRPCFLLLI